MTSQQLTVQLRMAESWAVDDSSGTQITCGLSSDEAEVIAKSIANRLGETVYLYDETATKRSIDAGQQPDVAILIEPE